MRRGFNKAILPKEAPKKNKILKKRKKMPRVCAMMGELLKDYRAQAGDSYDVTEFAAFIGVHKVTARRYFYGYMPHKDYHWPIARYFAQHLPYSAELIYADISSTYKEFRIEHDKNW